MEIHGERVVLRPATADDVKVLDEIVRQPGVARWWSLPSAEEYASMLCILLGEDRTIIGGIQYDEEDTPDFRHAAIDVFVGDAYQGRGLGTDAVRALARWLIRERRHHRLTIDPAAANTAAIRSYEKVGFRPVGILRQYCIDYPTGRRADGLLMDLLADELT